MLRAEVSGIDSRLLEQRVRQELAASPNDPAARQPTAIELAFPSTAQQDGASTPPADCGRTAPPTGAAPTPSIDGSTAPSIDALSSPLTPPALPPSEPTGFFARTTTRLAALYRRHSRHHQLQRNISEIWTWAEEMADRVHGLSRQIDALRLQLGALGDQHRELATRNRAQFAKQDDLHDQHDHRLDRLDRIAVRIQGDLRFEHRRLARLIDASGEPRTPDAQPAGTSRRTPPALSAASELSGRFAQGFEERFRGPREEIKGRLRIHLDRVKGQPVVTPAHPLLDIGCGRGEWLELLAEAAVPAYGIDANPHVVDACQRRGLAVSQADAIDHLAHLPERALGAVSAFHVIEHLPLEDMLRLIDEARRVLVPGGILLLETPNPESLKVGALTFHYDPTHLRPVPPLLVEYLVSSRGFHDVELMRLHPYPESSLVHENSEAARRLNDLVYGPQDTAVFARRA